MDTTYHRGDIYYADLGTGMGSEQSGYRPVIIIQNNIGNKYSSTVIVAAITTKIKSNDLLPTHCLIQAGNVLKETSVILLEQIRTIDKVRLKKYVGKIDHSCFKGINRSLKASLGLFNC